MMRMMRRILNSSHLDHCWITVGSLLDHSWNTVVALVRHFCSAFGALVYTFESLVICVLSLLAAS
eukprot:9402875-Heterocapsa_arctica.AAC.1